MQKIDRPNTTPILVKIGKLCLNVAVHVQVCRLFCVVYMPLFGLVQARPWFQPSMWLSSVAGISTILCTSEVAYTFSYVYELRSRVAVDILLI